MDEVTESSRRIREKLLRLCEGWLDTFGEQQLCDAEGPGATQDFRRIAQTCMDLGVLEDSGTREIEVFMHTSEDYGV